MNDEMRKPALPGRSRFAISVAIVAAAACAVAIVVWTLRARASDAYSTRGAPAFEPLRPGDDRRFDAALAALGGSAELTLLEGLPRSRDRRGSERTIVSGDQAFHADPLPLTPYEERQLRATVPRHALYARRDLGLYKLCDGFHADFAILWLSHAGSCEMQFCFGCGEVRLDTPDGRVELDMAGGATVGGAALADLLRPLGVPRSDRR